MKKLKDVRPVAETATGMAAGKTADKAYAQDHKIVRRALALKREGVFSLLVLLTALLGWVVALGAGGVMMLQQTYHDWSLQRQQTVTAYLPADSDPQAVATLVTALATEPGVVRAERVSDSALRELLAPYEGTPTVASETSALPLPVVIDIVTSGSVSTHDAGGLEPKIRAVFPSAELDDARQLLASVAKGVRLTQAVGLLLALVMVGVMLGLVLLTVRIGLRSQQATLALLRQLGASDHRLIGLVAAQVGERVLMGWLLAAGAAASALLLAGVWWPVLQPLMTLQMWLIMVAAPLLLPVVAVSGAALTAQRQLGQLV